MGFHRLGGIEDLVKDEAGGILGARRTSKRRLPGSAREPLWFLRVAEMNSASKPVFTWTCTIFTIMGPSHLDWKIEKGPRRLVFTRAPRRLTFAYRGKGDDGAHWAPRTAKENLMGPPTRDWARSR